MRLLFQIGGMRCASCQAHVTKAVKAVPGVRTVEVNLVTGRMTVEADDAPDMSEKIIDAVKNAGFTAELVEVEGAPAPVVSSKYVFQVGGMRCASCQAHVTKAVKAVPGVQTVEVNLVTGRMTVEADGAPDMSEKIVDAVKNAGFTAELVEGPPAPDPGKNAESAQEKAAASIPDPTRGLFLQFIWSLILMLPLMVCSFSAMHGFLKDYPLDAAWLQLIFLIPLLYVNRVYFISGAKRFLKLSPNMDSLIMLGSGASVLYSLVMTGEIILGKLEESMRMKHIPQPDELFGAARVAEASGNLYFETAGMILLLVTFGKYLEARAKRRTTDAVSRLMDLSPKTAVVLRGEKEVEIPADELAAGDIVVIRPGSSIPADGVVVSGNGTVDQSSVTGESVPAGKEPGDHVVSGTMNLNGSFRFRAERVGRDSTLSRIIQLVESASNSSAPISRFADRVSSVFVPVVLAAALVSGCIWLFVGHQSVYFALTTAIAVMVISCPCALGLATPIAIMVGTGVGSRHGILFKNATALEELHAVGTVVLDKTGTVTEGRHRVTRVVTLSPDGSESGGGEKDFLRIAAPLESKSEHPFARAVVQYAQERGMDVSDVPVEDFSAVPGMGVCGNVGGVRYVCGNARLMEREGIPLAAQEPLIRELESGGHSLLFLAERDAKRLCAVMALRDTVKEGSADALRALHELGLKTVLLTGDTEVSAAAAASGLQIDRVIAGVLPDGKEACIRELQQDGGRVAMVGDGINDAAALARADVGIAIGGGTDIAMETADVVLLRGDLRDVVTAVRLSRAVMRNIRLNLFWAFFYNVLGIPIAAGALYPLFGWRLHPMLGTAAMACSSLFVVTNALRLRKFR
jgi:heavy metal translocating P-type ATPase